MSDYVRKKAEAMLGRLRLHPGELDDCERYIREVIVHAAAVADKCAYGPDACHCAHESAERIRSLLSDGGTK
jgi:hypothetical protein